MLSQTALPTLSTSQQLLLFALASHYSWFHIKRGGWFSQIFQSILNQLSLNSTIIGPI